jgi:hypothetical protein
MRALDPRKTVSHSGRPIQNQGIASFLIAISRTANRGHVRVFLKDGSISTQ